MSFQLSETIADALLSKLGHDDGFRTLFAANPREALISLGFAPAADTGIREGIWMCMQVDVLASKEVIRAGHEQLRQQLTAARAKYTPITLGMRAAASQAA